MRTLLRRFGLFFLLLCGALLLACNGDATTEISVVGITVSADELPDRLTIAEFDLSELSITVEKSDGSTVSLVVTEAMLSSEDLAKLATPGVHTLTITYQGKTATVQVTLVENDVTLRLMAIYDLGTSTGAITGTYEEWLESVKGDDGAPGTDGRELSLRVEAGNIQWQYVGAASWTNLIAVSALTGAAGTNGTNGREVTFRIASGSLQWQYVGDASWTALLSLTEISGQDGVTPTIAISPEGFWVINGTVTDFRAVPLDPIVPTVDLTFNLNGGTLGETTTSQYLDIPKGDTVTLPIPEKHGYLFAGWFTGNTVNDGQFLNTSVAAKDLTLHARWKADTRPIEELLSNLISGPNYAADFTLVQKVEGDEDFREDMHIAVATDEAGRIHRTRTRLGKIGSETVFSTFRSSIILGEFEYFIQWDLLEEEDVNAGRTLADSRKSKIDWDAPRVDNIFEWFRIEDFQLRPDEFVFDYVASDDGLRAYASTFAGSLFDDEGLKATFNGETGILEITIPYPGDGEDPEVTMIQSIRLTEIGTLTNRFQFDDFRNTLISGLQFLVDTRIDSMLPTAETETAFLTLHATLSQPLPLMTDPALLWDIVADAGTQLFEYPLIPDARRIAVRIAQGTLLAKLNQLSLTATEESVAAMQAELETQKADLEATTLESQVAPLLASSLADLETLYVPDPVKIGCLDAKDRVADYLEQTRNFFITVLAPESSGKFDAELAKINALIAEATTSAQVYTIWDDFGTALQSAELTFKQDYEKDREAYQNVLQMTYLERTNLLVEEDPSKSVQFDEQVRVGLQLAYEASIYEFMHEYFAVFESMNELYRSLWMDIISERVDRQVTLMEAFATPEELTLFFNTMDPLVAALNAVDTGYGLSTAWDHIESAFGLLEFSNLTENKLWYFGMLEDAKNDLYLTADDSSREAMDMLVDGYGTYLASEAYDLEDVSSGYYELLAVLKEDYVFGHDRVLLESARTRVVDFLQKLQELYDMTVYNANTPFHWELEDAIHQALIAEYEDDLDSLESDTFEHLISSQIMLDYEAAQRMVEILTDTFGMLELAGIEPSSLLNSEFATFQDELDQGTDFTAAFFGFISLYSNLHDFYWNELSARKTPEIEQWYAEKMAISELSFLDGITTRFNRTIIFMGIVRDESLMDLVKAEFQKYLIACPADPVRLNRYEHGKTLLEEIDGYSLFITTYSLSSMVGLYDEFIDMLEGETDGTAMDSLLAIYREKVENVYDEDPQKVAFQNLKERYFILFDVFGLVYSSTVDYSAEALFDLENHYYQVLQNLEDLEYSLASPQVLLDGYMLTLMSYYDMAYGDEIRAIDVLCDQVEYLFLDYNTGGIYYLEEQIAILDALRITARNDVSATNLLGALYTYTQYAVDMKTVKLEAHRDLLLEEMLEEYNRMWARLPEADRPAFTDAYLTIRTRMENVGYEDSLEIVYHQYLRLLGDQIVDPLLDAKRTAIEEIQNWLTFHWTLATDGSRTDINAAQTAAYDAIYLAETVEDANAAKVNGKANLNAAYVEDSARALLYGTQMSEAVMILKHQWDLIATYSSDPRLANEALVILRNAETAIWTANDASQVTTALNSATMEIEGLGLSWHLDLVDEFQNNCLSDIALYLTFFETIPAEVQDARDLAVAAISGASDPFTIDTAYRNFSAIAENYL